MKQIKLTQGKYAIIDDSSFGLVSQYKWHFHITNGKMGYPRTMIAGKKIRLHTLLMKNPKGTYADHVNGNTLDNRRENLRICTPSESNANLSKRVGCSSKYKGISFDKERDKWQVRVYFKKKKVFFKRVNTEIEAARLYDLIARKIFGKFAKTNL